MTTEFKSWEELTQLEQARELYWDMYKDAYGVRPRGVDTSHWTLKDFEAEFEGLGVAIEAEEKIRIAAEQHAIFSFEKRIDDLIFSGAKDRATAMLQTGLQQLAQVSEGSQAKKIQMALMQALAPEFANTMSYNSIADQYLNLIKAKRKEKKDSKTTKG